MSQPRILLTNDDGISSPGLKAAYRQLSKIGEVTVVAPDAERSAMGHAITTLVPLRVRHHAGDVFSGHAVSGTPADCVKIALGAVMESPPDLVVSGINLGANTATHVIYSGTVSAATEARILGLPSMAVSLGADSSPTWSYAAAVTKRVASLVLAHGLPDRVLLNVNVPNLPRAQIRGFRITRQGDSRFVEELDTGRDPRGLPYYWLAGSYQMTDDDPSTDSWALEHGYVSITPLTYNLTATAAMKELQALLPRAGKSRGVLTASPARRTP